MNENTAIQSRGLTRGPIHLYYLNTGELSASEVAIRDDHAHAMLPPLFRSRLTCVPDDNTWTIQAKITGNLLTAVAGHSQDLEIIRLWVVLDGRDLARIVPSPRVLDLPVPICIIEALKPLPNPRLAGWLRVFAGALARDWMQHMDTFEINAGPSRASNRRH
jgi:hypothetical protein